MASIGDDVSLAAVERQAAIMEQRVAALEASARQSQSSSGTLLGGTVLVNLTKAASWCPSARQFFDKALLIGRFQIWLEFERRCSSPGSEQAAFRAPFSTRGDGSPQAAKCPREPGFQPCDAPSWASELTTLPFMTAAQ